MCRTDALVGVRCAELGARRMHWSHSPDQPTPHHAHTVVLPGFGAPAGIDLNDVARELTRCPEATFRSVLGAYSAGGVACTPCGSGLCTLPGIDGATSRDECLVAPGSGWDAATSTAADCRIGTVCGGDKGPRGPVLARKHRSSLTS